MRNSFVPLFLTILLSSLLFNSCKKNGASPDDDPTETTIDPTNAIAVSASIKVLHGTRIAGSAPAPNNNLDGPVLDGSTNNLVVQAIVGRYAIIQPDVSGKVKGYYVTVAGSTEYFKTDYSNPNFSSRHKGNGFIPPSKKKPGFLSKVFGAGVEDSSIVISIPGNIKPGAFCITYWAYDSSGNVSNPIVNCINISQFGGDASSAFLAGNWKASAENENGGTWTPFDYSATEETGTLYCNAQAGGDFLISFNCFSGSCTSFTHTLSYEKVNKLNLLFAANGAVQLDVDVADNYFQEQISSTCGQVIMTDDTNRNGLSNGAWSYTSSTKKLVIVLEFDEDGLPNPTAYDFTMTKDSDTQISLVDDDAYGTRFVKF